MGFTILTAWSVITSFHIQDINYKCHCHSKSILGHSELWCKKTSSALSDFTFIFQFELKILLDFLYSILSIYNMLTIVLLWKYAWEIGSVLVALSCCFCCVFFPVIIIVLGNNWCEQSKFRYVNHNYVSAYLYTNRTSVTNFYDYIESVRHTLRH